MTDQVRRTAFLQEMGVGPLWFRRVSREASPAVDAVLDTITEVTPVEPVAAQIPAENVDVHAVRVLDVPPGDAMPSMMSTSQQDTHADGVRDMDWLQLQEVVAGCQQCGLCRNRTNTVFGVGDPQARWLFVGEGPGRNEDIQGQPFVGPAGKLLDNMMGAMGLQRGQNTFIANIVKCRPTDESRRDRPPTLAEVSACMPYLKRQIALIKPTVIVALGKTAALSLLELDPATPVSRLRGKVHQYDQIPLIVTYHPAYLLRNLRDKRKTWDDLCLAMQTFAARD